MQLTPTKFLIPSGDDTRRFRINLEYFRKGHGGYQAKILKVVLPEAEQKGAAMEALTEAAVEAPDDVEGEAPSPETVAMDAAVDAMPEGGYPSPTTWTLNHCPPGDSWYLEASQPITGTHIVQVMAEGAQGSCAALVEIRPRTAEDDVAKSTRPQRRQAASQRASRGRRKRNNRGGK